MLGNGISKLRELVSEELGEDWYVFPILDSFDLRQRVNSGDLPIWPTARCLLKDGSNVDIALVEMAAEDEENKPQQNADNGRFFPEEEDSPKKPTNQMKPLSQLVEDFFYCDEKPLGRTSPVATHRKPNAVVKQDMETLMQSIYLGETRVVNTELKLLSKRHVGFVDSFGFVRSSSQQHCILLYRGNELTLRSFMAFNRQALRRYTLSRDYWTSTEVVNNTSSTSGEISSPPSSSSATVITTNNNNNSDVQSSSPPFLLGSDPIIDGECDDLPIRFLFFQAVQAVHFLHQAGFTHGSLSPDVFTITNNLWLEIIPPTSFTAPTHHSNSPYQVENDTKTWRQGDMSNFDYLMNINHASGRRTGGVGMFHAILPWVLDFEHAQGRARDLTKSKYRLKKGEGQLQATYQATNPKSTPHHIPESLSELTYYMYTSRNTPVSTLQHVVRPVFEPKEYPSSLARLYEWTPDECIPEFFVDAKIFLPTNLGLKCLVCGREDHGNNQEHLEEAKSFLRMHLDALETCDREGFAKWIDLHFGSHLQGRLAVDSLNVVLSPRSRFVPYEPFATLRRTPDFVRVFDKPHAVQCASTRYCFPPPATPTPNSSNTAEDTAVRDEETFLSQILLGMLAPRGGLKLIQSELKNSTFLGSDLVEWLLLRGIAGVDSTSDAVALAQKMMACGYFFPETNHPLLLSSPSVNKSQGEFDFVDADDCAYRFRIADNKKWATGAFPPGSPRANRVQDIWCEKSVVVQSFRAQQMCIDTETSGLIRTATYYPFRTGKTATTVRDDVISLCLIIGELYLGKPLEEHSDLDLLPLPVCLALKRVLQEQRECTTEALLNNYKLFPRHFAVAFDFCAQIRLCCEAERCIIFATQFTNTFAALSELGSKAVVEAAWLTFPLAHSLVVREPFRFSGVFSAMHRVLNEEPAFKAFVDSLVGFHESSCVVPCEEWVNALPVDAYLDFFCEALVWAMKEDASSVLVTQLERALLRADNHYRVIDLLTANKLLSHHAPIFKLLASNRHREDLVASQPGMASYMEDMETAAAMEDESSDEEAEVSPVTTTTESSSPPTGVQGATLSTTVTATPKRSIQFRFLAHSDAPISCMATSTHTSNVQFATASRKGEVALWNYSQSSITQSCRFRASEDAVRMVRFVNKNLLVGTVRNHSVAMFDLQDDSAVRATNWIPNVRCYEPLFHGNDDVVILGETTGDVSLADFRTAHSHLSARYALPVPKGSVVRSLYSRGAPNLVCSVNDRLFELDVRMVGRVCREWQAPSTVNKLFGLEHGRKLVSVMKGGNVATVWDICSGKEANKRLRAIAGFSDNSGTNKIGETNVEEMDSLVALNEDASGMFMYVVRGGHKMSRVPLTLLEDPKEVRVQPLSLTHTHPILGSRRYKPGHLCLTAVCVLPGHVVVAAGHDISSTKAFTGGYVHMVV